MKNLYLVILVLIAIVSSIWAAEPTQPDKPVKFLGIEMGEYIPRDAVEGLQNIKVPEGFEGCVVTVNPLTRRVTSVSLTKKLGSEAQAIQWMDTLISGLALSVNAQLVHDKQVYHFTKGRLSVTLWQKGSNAFLGVSDTMNDDIHSIVEDARGGGGAPTVIFVEKPVPTAPTTK